MRIKILTCAITVALGLTSCQSTRQVDKSSAGQRQIQGADKSPSAEAGQKQEQLKNEIDQVSLNESKLDQGLFEEARLGFQEFQFKFPNSNLKMQASIGLARAHFGLKNWDSAKNQYQRVIQSSTDPKIRGLALFYLSFCFEAEGDDLRQLTSLKDAENLAASMPPEIGEVLLPSRLGIYYKNKHDLEKAQNYLKRAEKGMQLRGGKKIPAHNYLEMGQNLMPSDPKENLKLYVENLKWRQIFLLNAIEADDPKWSSQSLLEIKKSYGGLISMLNPKSDPSLFEEDTYLQKFRLKSVAQEISSALNGLKRQAMVGTANPYLKDLNQYISQVESDLMQKTLDLSSPLPLTRESQKRSESRQKKR